MKRDLEQIKLLRFVASAPGMGVSRVYINDALDGWERALGKNTRQREALLHSKSALVLARSILEQRGLSGVLICGNGPSIDVVLQRAEGMVIEALGEGKLKINDHPRSYCRGWETYWDDVDGLFRFSDTGAATPGWGGELRPCKKCGAIFEEGEPDACFRGELPGVNFACCGHGVDESAYVSFENGIVIRGFTLVDISAIRKFQIDRMARSAD